MTMQPFQADLIPLEGTKLIEASAGTGKTYAITSLVLRFLLEKELMLDQILIVTFTKAATQELKDRVRDRISECLQFYRSGKIESTTDPIYIAFLQNPKIYKERAVENLEMALRSFDEAPIFTIHGFCYRSLSENAFECGQSFEFELLQNDSQLILDLVQDYWLQNTFSQDPNLIRALESHGFTSGNLFQLARARSNPKTPIQPEPPTKKPIVSYANSFKVYHELQNCWNKHQSEIKLYIEEHIQSFKATSYFLKTADWYEKLESFFLREKISFSQLPGPCKHFTAESIHGAFYAKFKPVDLPSHPFFHLASELLAEISNIKAKEETFSLWQIHQFLNWIPNAVKEVKAEKEVLGQDDLLNLFAEALEKDEQGELKALLQKTYKAALIDEFQDTDPVQYSIFQALFDPKNPALAQSLFLIGDPKQAIYGFRGADIFAYIQAVKEHEDSHYSMTTNWRSDEMVVESLNELYAKSDSGFFFDEIEYQEVKAQKKENALASSALEICFIPASEDTPPHMKNEERIQSQWAKDKIPAMVAEEIYQLLSSQEELSTEDKVGQRVQRVVEPGDIAVLVEQNKQATAIQEELSKRGITALSHASRNIYESEEAKELWWILRAILNYQNITSVKTALSTSIYGLTESDIIRFEVDLEAFSEWIYKFIAQQKLWKERGPSVLFQKILEDSACMERLLRQNGGERKTTNINHLFELLTTEQQLTKLNPQELTDWFGLQISGSNSSDTELELRLESDKKAVQLMTIHKSKGLEFPIVYLPYVWSSRQRKPSNFWTVQNEITKKRNLILDFKEAEEFIAPYYQENLAESLRLLYVAMTRAKHRNVLFWGPIGDYEKSAFCFLLGKLFGFGDPQQDLEKFYKSFKKVASEDLFSSLQDHAQASGAKVKLKKINKAPKEPLLYTPVEQEEEQLLLKPSFELPSFSSMRVSSYSNLTRNLEYHFPAKPEVKNPLDLPDSATLLEQQTRLQRFPKGANIGNMIHEVFEDLNFTEQASTFEEMIAGKFTKFGIHDLDPTEEFIPFIQECLDTPLAQGLRLADLSPKQCLVEMDFMIPASSESHLFNAADLAQALQSSSSLSPAYLSKVAEIDFAPFYGFMKGFIDLTFEHQGKFYILDYKSNYLGPDYSDYQAENLIEAMDSHHYNLQYHIYTLALTLYLKQRQPDFDYETHFGGVYYLFLRGMHPKLSTPELSTGIFFDRPSESTIANLIHLFLATEAS